MDIFVKYAVNKSQGVVQIVDGRVRIPVGGWKGLTRIEVDHPDIVDALRRDWIDLVDQKPTSPEDPPKKPLKIYSADGTTREMSPDELDKTLASKAKSEPIGSTEEAKVEEESKVDIRPSKKRIPKA